MKKSISILLFIVPLIIISQDSLSIKDAIELGLKNNFDIQLTKKKLSIDSIFNTWGEAGRYPSVDLNAGQNNSISDQSNNPTSFVNKITSNSLDGGLSLNWTIFNGFNVRANKIKLEQLQSQSEGNVTLLIENTIHGIILSYYQIKLQRDQLSLLKNILELSRKKYLFQKTKNDMGLGVTIDLLQFENGYLQDSSNLILQELNYKNSVRNLNLIMGSDIDKQWVFNSNITPPNKFYNLEDLKQKMLSSNSNIKNQYLNISLIKQDIQIAKSVFYPVLSFNAGGNFNTSRFNATFSIPGSTTTTPGEGLASGLNYYGNFTLNFRIFDGGKVRRGIQALKVQEEVNVIEKTQLEQQLLQELLNTYDSYQTRIKIFEINKRAFQVAEKNFRIAELKENSGLINSFNLRDIEMAYLSAGIALFQSSYNLIESNATLTKLTGGIIQEYGSEQ
jgi:outer membrane protein TolC